MFLSVYENKLEKKIDKFLSRVKRRTDKGRVRNVMMNFLTDSPVELILWLEYKYKGYKFLKKRRRRQIYDLANLIEEDFLEFRKGKAQLFDEEKMRVLFPVGLGVASLERMWELLVIARFLKSKYKYRESSAFWKLFPLNEGKMIGDCNQIVAVYMWLYGLSRDMTELRLKHWPGHVCLSVDGFDFEATVGEFKNYGSKGEVIGIENIIPMNLLDVDDPDEKTWNLGDVKFAQMTVLISKFEFESKVVDHNLRVAYLKLGVMAINNKDWPKARHFFELSGDEDKAAYAWESEIRWLVEIGRYADGIRIAKRYGNAEFLRYVRENYCLALLKKKSFKKAELVAAKIGGEDFLRKCWVEEFNYWREKVDGINLVKEMKKHRKKYRRMYELARKLKDKDLQKNLIRILKEIG